MKLQRLLLGVSSAALVLAALIMTIHLVARAAQNGPAIHVDSTPVSRDTATGNGYANVVKKVAPSVVNIYSSRTIRQRYHRNPIFNDPFFRQFFGNIPDDEQEFTRQFNWLGSGMIVTPDGYILTANHVVDGADEIKVGISSNKTEYAAQIIGTDPQTDVAVLKIEAQNLPAITLGDSSQIAVGDAVLAIGNPLGLGQTVTHGIVSALGRSVPMGNANGGYPGRYQDFIQTDAAINHGNSGGALVDAQGRLIGINDAIIEGGTGIGLAIPINMARGVMEGFLNGGKVVRGDIGITLQDLDNGLAKSFGLASSAGVLVAETISGAPAEAAGLKSGDIILALNDQPVASADNFRAMEAQLQPRTAVNIKIFRNGAEKTVSVTPAERQEAVANSTASHPAPKKQVADMLNGVRARDLNPQLRMAIAAPENLGGAIIMEVDNGSNAASAGLQQGDVIQEINRQPVANFDDAKRLGLSATGDRILVKIWRNTGGIAGTRFVSVDNTRPAQ
jgi:serine protease Do